MKRNFKITIIAALLLLAPLFMLAQPPHPNGGNAPGPGNTKVGDSPAGAPVGSGTILLLTLAAAYGGRKIYGLRSEAAEE